jgi:ABC-type multidrug transport system fused ATPase/permease subunit
MKLKDKIFFILTSREIKNFKLLIFLMILGSAIEALSIYMIMPAISILIDRNYLEKIKLFFYNFFGDSFSLNNFFYENFLFFFIIFILSVFVIKFIYMCSLIYVKMNYVNNVSTRLSSNIYSSYLSRPYNFHLKNTSSQLILNATSEVQNFSIDILSSSLEIIIEIIMMLGLIFLLLFIEPIGSIIIFFLTVALGYLYHTAVHKKSSLWGYERRKSEERGLKLIREGLGGIKELVIFAKKKIFEYEYFQQVAKFFQANKKQQTLLDTTKYYIELVAIFSAVILLFFLINTNEVGLVIIKLSLFVAVFFKILPALNRVIAAKQRVVYSLVALDKIYQEIKFYKNLKQEKKNNQPISFSNNICLKNISFGYTKKEKILKKLNLTIKKGEILGLIGPSGSGKSTIINIIIGLLNPDSGTILVDDVPLDTKRKVESWQKKIGYIPQNFFMLNDTIRANIVFEPNYLSSKLDNNIYDSLKKSQINNFVKSLPKKLDTVIGERGSKISVGQAQRLSIARALYKKPDILILDEATSALDPKNEINFLNVISRLKKKITIVIISHKPNTLKFCDNIYKLEKLCLKKIKI